MDNIQGYSSENDSDNNQDYTDTSKLKSFKGFKNEKLRKGKIELQQPLQINLGVDKNGKYDDDSHGEYYEGQQITEPHTEQGSTKEETAMAEFNTSEFYKENTFNKDKYEGQLKSNEPLKQLTSGSTRLHQLSNLIKLGRANEAKLQEMHNGSKVHKPKIQKNKK